MGLNRQQLLKRLEQDTRGLQFCDSESDIKELIYEEKDLTKVVENFKKLSKSKFFRSRYGGKNNTYELTIRRLASTKQFSAIEEILEEQKKYNDILKEGFAIRIISVYGKAGMVDHAFKMLEQLPELKCDRTIKSVNALLSAYVDSKKMLDEMEKNEAISIRRHLYYFRPRKRVISAVFTTFQRKKLSVQLGKYCRGSSHGWLIIQEDEDILSKCINSSEVNTVSFTREMFGDNNEYSGVVFNYSLNLYNPFSCVDNVIEISPIRDNVGQYMHIDKVIVSVDPSRFSDFSLMGIYFDKSMLGLVFFRAGEKDWLFIKPSLVNKTPVDVIYFQVLFYVINLDGTVCSIDIRPPQPKETLIKARPPSQILHKRDFVKVKQLFLVELFGELLQVIKITDPENGSTVRFYVFKLDPIAKNWIEVKTLGGHMIFVCYNSSFCVSATNFPGCKPNCIYFANKSRKCAHRMLVFNIENESFVPHQNTESNMFVPPFIWIQPIPRQRIFLGGSRIETIGSTI
ncbi:hypothetical protein GIB67_013074 [Kingdonia uniflora]|uniref:KIB1-4 beta-propeller domain-containing protein n=1 Tax=Kingdonia uniflora TaxID=39325 RepID=A0A7J7MCP1_9MAGN|nr:hypothetical protein GIB67_013074 [Kingdonia uniflora]